MSFVPAVALLAKEKRVIAALQAAGALSHATARSPSDLGISADVAVQRLRRSDILRDGPGGTLYLDQASWEAQRTLQRSITLTTSLVVLAGITLFFVLRG